MYNCILNSVIAISIDKRTENHLVYRSLISVGGSIFLKDYWEAGTIVFLLNISEWLETRASHKVFLYISLKRIIDGL